jgi:regulator of sigma E protease
MTIFDSVVPFIAIIVVLVLVHEFGHFITAKLSGVKVLEFGIGYPPRLWAIRRGETDYSINALPLGGFVRLLGEEDPSDPQSLAAKPRPTRLVVLSAGSIMNFLLPIVLFSASFMIPREVSAGRALIHEVMPGSPAEAAGLQQGDVIYKIDGRDVKNVQEAGYDIRLNLGETVDITVKRENEFITIPVKARWAAPDIVHVVQPGEDVISVAEELGLSADSVRQAADIESTLKAGQELTIGEGPDAIVFVPQEGDTVASAARRLGVSEEAVAAAAGLPNPDELKAGQELRIPQGPTGIIIGAQYPFTETQSYAPLKAVRLGVRSTFDSLTLFRNEVVSWFKGGGGPKVAGPVGIAQTTGEVVENAGWRSLLEFTALLSINLAVINILPLPMLDGGRVVFVLLEIVRRGRRIAPQKEALVHLIGLAAILILAVVLSYFDVVRLIQGESLFR